MCATTLADIATSPAATVSPDSPVRDALETMQAKHISALAITKKQQPLGIFTEQDVVYLACDHRDITTITAAEVMSQSPLTAPLDMDCWNAYRLFKTNNKHHLIVVDYRGQLVGIVSESDYLDNVGLEYTIHSKQVSSVMAQNVLCLPEDATVKNAIRLMAHQHLSCVVVEYNATPIGTLTASNLIGLICDNIDLASMPLKDLAINPLHSICSYTALDDAVVLMKKSHIQHLVVEDNGNIVGLLKREDIIDLLYSNHLEHKPQNVNRLTQGATHTHNLTSSRKAIQLEPSLCNGVQQRTKFNTLERINLPEHRHQTTLITNSVRSFSDIRCPLCHNDVNCEIAVQSHRERAYRHCELFESISDWIAVYQAVGDGEQFIIEDINRAGERIGDILREEVSGRNVRDIFPGIDEMGLFEVFQRVWRTGKPEHHPATLYRDKRLALWVENYVFKLPSGEIVAVHTDITQRQQAEESLRKSESVFRTLARLLPVGIFRTDTDGRCTYANEKCAELLGIDTQGCLLGRNWMKNLHAQDKSRIRERWIQAVEARQTFREEFRFDPGDIRDIWVTCQATPEVGGDGKVQGYIGTITDITTLKTTQAALARTHDELEQRVQERTAELQAANRELESFTYSVSHDLRAPLRAITGFSHALIEDFGKLIQGEAKLYLDQLIESGNYMRDIIDGLLKLSRSTCGELNRKQLDLSAMASSIIQQLREQEPIRAITTEIQPGMELIGDPRLIKLVMINLLSNAWKYTVNTARPTIRVYLVKTADEPLYCIEDNGAGFDMAYADKLFAPFQRLHRQNEFPGIGVGLATVQRIIQRHGGQVQGIGEIGKGAKICFTVGNAPKKEAGE